MSTELKLKPCSFCNSRDLNLGHFIDDSSVHCSSCRKLVILPISRNNTTEAIEAWNHRPFEEHAVEVLAQQIGLREACAWGDIVSLEEFKEIWERGSSDKYRDKCRAQARELLGIKE